MFAALKNKEKKIAIVGLGYVGLPLAMGFADKLSVIGYDINEDRLAKLREGIDPNGDLESSQWKGKDIEFTSSVDKLKEASFYVIAVPTPISIMSLI